MDKTVQFFLLAHVTWICINFSDFLKKREFDICNMIASYVFAFLIVYII